MIKKNPMGLVSAQVGEARKVLQEAQEHWKAGGSNLGKSASEMTPEKLHSIADLFLNVLVARLDVLEERIVDELGDVCKAVQEKKS